MQNDHPVHAAVPRRGAVFADVHDIRALTDTGAIVIPHRSRSGSLDRARPASRSVGSLSAD